MSKPERRDIIDADFKVIRPARSEPIEFERQPLIGEPGYRYHWLSNAAAGVICLAIFIPGLIGLVWVGRWIYLSLMNAWGVKVG